jgi:hypothetical protein
MAGDYDLRQIWYVVQITLAGDFGTGFRQRVLQ